MARDGPGRRDAPTRDGLTLALRPLDELAPYLPAWRDLAGRALVENLFYEPAYLLAGAHAFGARISLLIVADGLPETPGARILALWPFRITYRWGPQLAVLEGFRHGFSLLGAPLIDRSEAARALAALLSAPAALDLPPRLLIPYLPLDGPLAALVNNGLAASGRRRADFWTHERGLLDLTRHADFAAELSPNRRRQLARMARRMEAAAPVTFETLREPARLADALEDYIALERAGWKGRAGQDPADHDFLRRIVEAYGSDDRVRIDRLRREGRSLAVSVGLRTAGTFWYLKISHAEDEARNSPGSQLAYRVTRTLFEEATLRAADSCAPQGLTMIEALWRDRLRLAHVLIEAGDGDRLFPLALGLERLRAAAASGKRAMLSRLART